MADDKKPKIDLKSRLQRMGGPGAVAPPPAPRSSAPPPVPRGPGLTPVPPPSIPPPSGIPRPMLAPQSSASALDANNPLAAVAQPFRPQSQAAPAVHQPQRIEVDEGAVQAARSSARKQGLIVGVLFAVVLGGIGYIAGGASQQGADRTKSSHDAHELATDLTKAKDTIDQMKVKVTDGGKSIIGDRKFPADLAKQLSGMHVDFAGDKLFGRRFSGVPADTTTGLFDFINRVEALNSKKDLIVALLNKLQKPISEELARPAGQLPLTLVAIVDKSTGDLGTLLAPLVTPIAPDDKNGVPDKLTFTNPKGGNTTWPRFTGDKIPKDGAVMPVSPTSFDKVCPSPLKGSIAQLMTSMNSLIDDIQGQKGDDSIGLDAKPGLSDQAAKLAESLNKVN
ncbi:MAG: hypothetical protein ABSE49_25730 [Polyangiaceae bacterium]|jgi:hypothetical protein